MLHMGGGGRGENGLKSAPEAFACLEPWYTGIDNVTKIY